MALGRSLELFILQIYSKNIEKDSESQFTRALSSILREPLMIVGRPPKDKTPSPVYKNASLFSIHLVVMFAVK